MKAPPPNAQALNLLEQALQDATWRVHWDAHAQRFSTSFTEALRGPLRSLGVGTSVAVAYTAARSAVSLAPAAYHETWARVTLAVLVRETLRRGQGVDELVADELGRIALELTSAADRIGARSSDEPRHKLDALLPSAHEALARAREALLADGAPRAFVEPYFEHIKLSLPRLAARDAGAHGLLRAAILEANTAARQHEGAWAGMLVGAKRALIRRCLAETAAALVEGAPNALAQSAQGGNREGKEASMALARASCQLLSSLTSVEGWVWEADHEVAPPPPMPSRPVEEISNTTTANPPPKVQPTMTTTPKPPIMKTLQNDAVDAAWRTAASQFVKLTREPLVAVLSRHLGPDDESMRKKIADFLSTEVGTALLTSVLSVGLSAMPATGNEAPQRLARELRVKAMTDMGDVVADVLMGPLRQVMSLYLQGVPANLPAEHEPPELPPASPSNLPTTSGEVVGSLKNSLVHPQQHRTTPPCPPCAHRLQQGRYPWPCCPSPELPHQQLRTHRALRTFEQQRHPVPGFQRPAHALHGPLGPLRPQMTHADRGDVHRLFGKPSLRLQQRTERVGPGLGGDDASAEQHRARSAEPRKLHTMSRDVGDQQGGSGGAQLVVSPRRALVRSKRPGSALERSVKALQRWISLAHQGPEQRLQHQAADASAADVPAGLRAVDHGGQRRAIGQPAQRVLGALNPGLLADGGADAPGPHGQR
jgi:hypothetical protein